MPEDLRRPPRWARARATNLGVGPGGVPWPLGERPAGGPRVAAAPRRVRALCSAAIHARRIRLRRDHRGLGLRRQPHGAALGAEGLLGADAREGLRARPRAVSQEQLAAASLAVGPVA